MSTLHFTKTTTATPEQFLAGLTDFGPGRQSLFPNSADDHLIVHHLHVRTADVTEGGGGTWERLHYDWTDPRRIVLTTTDSNVWGGASGYTYTLTRQPHGTVVDVVIVREGKNLKGRFLGLVLGTIGKQVIGKALDHTVEAIEARNHPVSDDRKLDGSGPRVAHGTGAAGLQPSRARRTQGLRTTPAKAVASPAPPLV